MSYGINLWSQLPISPNPESLSKDGWKREEDSWVYGSDSWQIVIGSSDRVESADMPEGIDAILPGIEYLTAINLEPISAPKNAHQILSKVIKALSKEMSAVVEDPQKGKLTAPLGKKRVFRLKAKNERKVHFLEMSWWFEGGKNWRKDMAKGLIEAIAALLPEVMPRRYGLYEPPQHKLEDTGKEHFVKFIQSNDSIVWYPSFPAVGVYLGVTEQAGWTTLGSAQRYRCNRFSVQFHTDVLNQPGWELALRHFLAQHAKVPKAVLR